MADNLLDLALREVPPEVERELAGAVAEPGQQTTGAVRTVTGVLTAAVAERGGNELGAAQLLTEIRAGGYDTDLLPRMTEVLSSPQLRERWMASGNRIVATLLVTRYEAVLQRTARHIGLAADSTAALLSLLGPVVMRALGAEVRSRKLDARALSAYLATERAPILSALPPALVRGLAADKVITLPSTPANTPERKASSPAALRNDLKPKLLWPLVAGLLAAFLVFAWARSHMRKSDALAPPAVGGGPREVPTGVPAIENYLASPRTDRRVAAFSLDATEFEAHSADLSPAAKAEVDELARVLSRYPQAKIAVVGHAGVSGDPDADRALAEARAEAVASELGSQGIALDRIAAAGALAEGMRRDGTPGDGARARSIAVVVFSP